MRAVTLSLAVVLLGVFFVSSVLSSSAEEAKVAITPMKTEEKAACGGNCVTSKQCADWGGKDCRCTLFFCVKYSKDELNKKEQLLEHYRKRTPRF